MSFNYLTNSGGFTRIAAYVGQMVDHAVDMQIEKISQNLQPDPATRCLNKPTDLSALSSVRFRHSADMRSCTDNVRS